MKKKAHLCNYDKKPGFWQNNKVFIRTWDIHDTKELCNVSVDMSLI